MVMYYGFQQRDGTVHFIVPRQRDNGTSSKSCHVTGRGGTTYQNPGRDAGQDNHYFFPMISCFRTSFPILERTFPVLERPFPILERQKNVFAIELSRIIVFVVSFLKECANE